MDKDLQTVLDNDEVKEGTFLYFLREEATFHEESFWDYYNSVISVIKRILNQPLDRTITKAIVSTHSKILESFLWHLTKDDVFKINNYPHDKIPLFVERLRFMLDGYLKGYVIDEESFGDELINPKHK